MKRRKITGVLMAASFVLSSWQTGAAAEELKEGQRKAAIMVVSITGNELTYYEVEGTEEGKTEESETEEKGTEESETEERGTEEGEPQGSESGQASGSGENQQEEKAPSDAGEWKSGRGEMPEGFAPGQNGDGEMPEGFASGRMGNGETPEDISSDQSEDGENTQKMGGGAGRRGMQIQTKTVYLPVAVAVHTDTGEEMTFSILEAGDELEVLFEEVDGEEIIAEIWMTDTAGESA